ncbi:exodeoxyribonuclease III Xth [Xylanimonas cellulosilytica DSM 15894]|uniref:Exodeoxyribonuclease III Xth n=1 Tax=Xylanimonas cellulosilytica (strain DSM 15894 / JCM 12276 / CECT 5975 / KCTC 9989 / LMG 20990 / NBRC 107835 / XIL07) TaxID=446471 RepID=D1BXI6_XYLCX|nr:exodeoxyribonuclease III [Xylanimonas cellulosilytica]ACZ29796.1 exodeoxyribonuclease III Xth [Xylanimonas cellulosilytica DSM 15894]
MLTVATANVNGIRAAMRRGMDSWIADRSPDVLLMQEVRAPDAVLDGFFDGWHVAHQACDIKGRAGVAVASRLPVHAVRVGLEAYGPRSSEGGCEPEPAVDTGRWVEADVELPGGGLLTVVSAYIHSGSTWPVDNPVKMVEKYAYLEKVTARLAELGSGPTPTLVAGDLNIAHHNVDIANWKGNLKNAGFLPEERAYLDRWFDELGWTDLGRAHGGEGPGPYTWWSWRGQAYVNDKGWRIDYQLANPALAPRALKVEVDRAPTYEERWSDHAPLIATYDL